MKDLDQLIENSMRALEARNEFVFESTQKHMHSVLKGGAQAWPWITALSVIVIVIVGITWYTIQQSSVKPVNVVVPEIKKQVELSSTDAAINKSVDVAVPPVILPNEAVEHSPQSMNVRIQEDNQPLLDLYKAQTSLAEKASSNGDHLLAATTYRDLARTCLLNNNTPLARAAIDKAIDEAKHVTSASFREELEQISRNIQ